MHHSDTLVTVSGYQAQWQHDLCWSKTQKTEANVTNLPHNHNSFMY